MYLSVKNSKNNLKLIRRFNEDLWGKLALLEKPNKVLNYTFDAYQISYKHRNLLRRRFFFFNKKRKKFRYKISTDDKEFKRRKRGLKRLKYLAMLKLRRFYGSLGKRKFKRLFRQASIHSNALGHSFAYLLESRLDVIMYRSNFFNSIFAARQFINHKGIYINGNCVTKPSFKLYINDIIILAEIYKFYKNFIQNLINDKILTNYPCYLEINYKLGLISLVKMPMNREVPFPFFMNLNNLTHSFLK